MTDDQTVTCTIHGEVLPISEARTQGWLIREDGEQTTVCRHFSYGPVADKIEHKDSTSE